MPFKMPLHLARFDINAESSTSTNLYLNFPPENYGKFQFRQEQKNLARLIARDRERGRQQIWLRGVPSAEVIIDQPISDGRVADGRDVDEKDDAALKDSLPGRRRGNIVEPAEQYGSTAPCFFVPYRNNPASASRNLL